ncbi:hypothetical protein LPN04_29350 [Rugamonas sp. A1-17]|nr:hypothetical protein [Rugamonas sp. A1-17]
MHEGGTNISSGLGQFGVSANKYDKILGYTELRRNDINTAKNLLISMEPLRLVRDDEHARRPSDPHHMPD